MFWFDFFNYDSKWVIENFWWIWVLFIINIERIKYEGNKYIEIFG